MHLTLRFLGDIDEAGVELVGAALRGIAGVRPPLPIRPAGTGGFPTPHAARVLWAGLDGGGALADLAAATDKIAAGVIDQRPFVPHVTIARFGVPRDVRAIDLWGANRETEGEVCLLSRVVLLESRLSPSGPSYTALRDIRLAGGERAAS